MQIIKPVIDAVEASNNQWLYDVLESKKEVEFRVVEKENWLLNLDWECQDTKNQLYCLAIPQDRSLKTVRDLTGDHLDLLNEIRKESFKGI